MAKADPREPPDLKIIDEELDETVRIYTPKPKPNGHAGTVENPAAPMGGPANLSADDGDIQLLNFEEYRAANLTPEASTAIEGLCRYGTLMGTSARPSWGKTALMVHMAHCASNGLPFLGRETIESVVVYIACEDQEDVVNRLEAIRGVNIFIVRSARGLPLTKPDKARKVVMKAIRLARERRPGLPVILIVDTLRAALGTQSVMDDHFASPALNALREVAEREQALIMVANHTNRENPKQTKGETLEAVAATELIIVKGEGTWFDIFVGKNRCGPSNQKIGRMSMTSVKVGGVDTAIIDQIVPDGENSHQKADQRKPGKNQKLVIDIVRNLVIDAACFYPFGAQGPCVKAVRENEVREEFIKRRAGDDKREKTKRFLEALQSLLDNGTLVRTEIREDEGMLWFGDRQRENSLSEDGEDEP